MFGAFKCVSLVFSSGFLVGFSLSVLLLVFTRQGYPTVVVYFMALVNIKT